MDEAKLAEIEARANAATPGPWIGDGEFGFVFQRGASRAHCIARLDHEDVRDTSGADLAFLAHTRTDVPTLVAEVRRLTAALAARENYDMDHALRDAAEQAELLQHGAERARDNARADLARLRAEHAAALDAARREGAEGMLARCRTAALDAFMAHPLTMDPRHEPGCICHAIARGSCSECDRGDAIMAALAALPLDAPGGGS